jgi:hypothetical protein
MHPPRPSRRQVEGDLSGERVRAGDVARDQGGLGGRQPTFRLAPRGPR